MKTAVVAIAVLAGVALLIWAGTRYLNNKSRFRGPTSVDEPLPEALIVALEDYVGQTMDRLEVPGVALVLVHGDQVVYRRGLGVRDLQTKTPVTTETLFGIGSATKPMTAVMIASLVDEGLIRWDTPVTELLPTFALSNPRVTSEVAFEQMLCMCTGVPRRMEEITVRYSEMTAEEIIESLATIPLSGSFGQSFNYSSRMFAAGGYLAALAAGGEYGNLAQAYYKVMQERLLDPLQMTSSTFSIDRAVAGGNYATPYYSSLGGVNAISPDLEGIFTPIAPAGALWSNADDLAKFLIMLLNVDASPDGSAVISAQNLATLWEPRVAVDNQSSYGLGWYVEDYHGLTVIHHPGGTVGFASELVVIPERDIGFALLTNRLDQVAPIGRMATYRLLEMLTGSEQTYDQEMRRTARRVHRQVLTLSLLTRKRVDPDQIAPYLGRYENDVLGEVELVLHQDNSLWVDFGEYESEVRRMALQKNQFIFFESAFIGKTLTLSMDSNGNATLKWSGDEAVYSFRPSSRVGE
jgi:CubicO group peptidase (beta-lactamase class C family)